MILFSTQTKFLYQLHELRPSFLPPKKFSFFKRFCSFYFSLSLFHHLSKFSYKHFFMAHGKDVQIFKKCSNIELVKANCMRQFELYLLRLLNGQLNQQIARKHFQITRSNNRHLFHPHLHSFIPKNTYELLSIIFIFSYPLFECFFIIFIFFLVFIIFIFFFLFHHLHLFHHFHLLLLFSSSSSSFFLHHD